MWFIKVLDAVSLEERFRKALPMLSRQIEGLKLLQKTRKMSPDTDKRVSFHASLTFLSQSLGFYVTEQHKLENRGILSWHKYRCNM